VIVDAIKGINMRPKEPQNTDVPGRPPLPTRLMAGLAILKHMHDLSDEALCDRWVENPYYQLFCGEAFF
jgi:IS5 family transposase